MLRKRILGRKSNAGYEEVHSSCVVRFLDDTEPLTVPFQKDTPGQYILDFVCAKLDLAERDYFGLRYVDSEKQRHWLDPTRSVHRQLKNVDPMALCFRVKFYPSEPLKLKEEITRYYLFLQLSRDFYHGRLLCSQSEACHLAALLIQADLGDYSTCCTLGDEDGTSYVTKVKNLPKQIQKQEDKVAEVHKTLSGMTPAEAEEKFIEMASHLDTYGVDPHPVKDQSGNSSYLGVTHVGIVTFQGNKRTHLFQWPQITKVDFEGKHLVVQVKPSEDGEKTELVNAKKKKQSFSFKCASSNACKHLWKCAVQQQCFFTLHSSTNAPKVKAGGGLFRRPSKYRFSGHCESEVLAESAGISRAPPTFKRSTSNPQFLLMFDKLGTGSLPASVRETKTKDGDCDVILERPRSESLDRGMSSVLEKVDEKVVEETPVQVFDVSYNPMLSPETEELPQFPEKPEAIAEEDSGVDLSAVSDTSLSFIKAPMTEMEFSELAAADLDAQIKELQMELEKCKSSSVVSSVSPPVVTDDPPFPEVENGVVSREILPPEAETPTANGSATTPKKMEPVNNSVSNSTPLFSWNRVLYLLLAFLVLSLVCTVLLFETNPGIPFVTSIRRWQLVKRFRSQFYRPLRSAVVQYLR